MSCSDRGIAAKATGPDPKTRGPEPTNMPYKLTRLPKRARQTTGYFHTRLICRAGCVVGRKLCASDDVDRRDDASKCVLWWQHA